MSGFKYRARTHEGDIREGVVQALTPDDAMRVLVRNKLIPESVEKAPEHESFRLRRRVKPKALSLFTRQFATLVDAAVPLVTSLEVLGSLTDDRALRRALDEVSRDIQTGHGVADAMRRHPKVFSDIYVNMVEAGEEGGVLDVTLLRLATFLEKKEELRSRVKAALIYPSIIVLVAVGAIVALLTFVVPTFQEMFEAGGLALPYPTMLLIRSSEFVRTFWPVLLAAILTAGFWLRYVYGTPMGRRIIDSMSLKIPLIGNVLRKAAVARFARTMSSLLSSGSSVLDAVEASARSCGNAVIEHALIKTRPSIAAGQGISEPLAATGVLPQLVARMVQVGEETGRIDEMFTKIADFFESEVDAAVEGLMKAIEPALVVVIGVILGAMVVAMYLPIFEALTQVA